MDGYLIVSAIMAGRKLTRSPIGRMVFHDPPSHLRRTEDAAGVIPRHGKDGLHDDVWFVVHCMDESGGRSDEAVGTGVVRLLPLQPI